MDEKIKNPKVERIIATIEQIPTLPVISQQIMELLNNEDVAIKEIAVIIEKDPPLAIKVLKIANSPFYGIISNVTSINHALAILGLNEIKAILLAFSIHNFFQNSEFEGIDRRRFWKHSVVCSQIAKYLSQHFKESPDEALFLAALIHDMGKMVFDQFFHDDFVKIVRLVNDNGITFSKAEKRILGVTHSQVAAKLLQKWHFPRPVITQVYYHHAPWLDKNHSSGSIIVYLANVIAKLTGFTSLDSEPVPDIDRFIDSKVMEFIDKAGYNMDEKTLREIVRQVMNIIYTDGKDMLTLFE